MILSMAAITLVSLGIYLFIPHTEGDPVKEISYRAELATARRAAPYPLMAPQGLSKEWRATSVRYDGANPVETEWHLGFINPHGEYAAVEQSNASALPFVEDKSKQAVRKGTMRVGGEEWQRYDGAKYNALVRQDKDDKGEGKGYTVMVTGTAPHDQLAELAAALKP
jgi:Protein of unknown function (DUF4245)